jgi:hypothetical protein
MEELKEIVKKCQEATPLQFDSFYTEYKNLLKKHLVLEEKDFFEILNLLIEWVTYFENNNITNPLLLESLLIIWDHKSSLDNPESDCEGVIGDLAATLLCSQKNLIYICETLKDSTNILSILDLHIRTRYGTGMIFSLVAERLLKSFNLENLEDFQWEHLEDTVEETLKGSQYDPRFISRESYSEKRDCKDVLSYIESKKKEKNKILYAPIPKWVSVKPKETLTVYENRNLGSVNEDDEKELENIKENFEKTVHVEKLRELNSEDQDTQISKNIPDGMASMIVALKENTKTPEDFPVERFYGVANSILGKECACINGPCRMFYCICREDVDYEDISYLDDRESLDPQAWFNGACEHCERKIRKFRHAIRFPILGGGWIGCFCSFDCLYKSDIRPIYNNENLLINEVREMIEGFGVYNY